MATNLPPVRCEHAYPHIAHKHRNPDYSPAAGVEYWARCPGVKGGHRFYRPGLRNEVLTDLRAASRLVHYMISGWSCGAQVWTNGQHPRPRAIAEYPENSIKEWDELHDDLDTTIARLSALRELAAEAAVGIKRAGGS